MKNWETFWWLKCTACTATINSLYHSRSFLPFSSMVITCVLTVCAQNPSDSELEDRITKIIAEEDEEIIRHHCYDYRSPPAPASASSLIRPSTTPSATRHVSDKSNSIAAHNCDASDIDDDELHQLLGVDWWRKFLSAFSGLCRLPADFSLCYTRFGSTISIAQKVTPCGGIRWHVK